jgi:hypothetical protein
VRLGFDFSGAKDPGLDETQIWTLQKETGAVLPLPLTPDGEHTAHLDVTLPAGDPILYKYATGAPFVTP